MNRSFLQRIPLAAASNRLSVLKYTLSSRESGESRNLSGAQHGTGKTHHSLPGL